ncbi:MAG: T9SS type A sorting domain-containing protein [bacterium]
MRFTVLLCAWMLLLPVFALCQTPDEVVLPGYATSMKYLNDQIMGDTTATGARVNANRTYVLKRNEIYIVVSSIRNAAWKLRIRAEAGTGKKPVVYTFKNPSTNAYIGMQFDVRGDLWLKNIAFVGWSTLATDLSVMPPRIIQVNSTGNTVEVDSCVLVGTRAATIETPSATKRLQVTNTTFAQSGNLFATNIGNGRPIDCRNVSIDSVIVRNCTFLDGTDRILRHYSSIGALKYVFFDHNTIANSLSMHGCLGLGIVGEKVIITNNLFVDNFVLGNDSSDAVRLSEFGDTKEKGPSGAYRMTFVGSVPDTAGQAVLTQWIVRNNYYAVSSAVQTWYNSKSSLSIGNLVPLTWHINKKLGADSVNAFKKESITFNKLTRYLVPFATWYYDPNGANKQKVNTGFTSAIDFDRNEWNFYTDTLDLRYQTTAQAYTGADNGQPAGSLMWWKMLLTGVEKDADQNIPQSFSLAQNYPNPFNPNTKISFSLPASGRILLKVFNVLGQEVRTLVDAHYLAGKYEVEFDAGALSSGVYIYSLTSGNSIASKKMTLVK